MGEQVGVSEVRRVGKFVLASCAIIGPAAWSSLQNRADVGLTPKSNGEPHHPWIQT
jgi:hypothetical protein